MAKLNMAQLFTVFLLMVIGLALTPTVVEQVGYVTGTGGDNLTGASISIMIRTIIIMIALSVSVGTTNSVILGYHNLVNRRCIYLYSIPRYKLNQESNESVGSSCLLFPRFLGVRTII